MRMQGYQPKYSGKPGSPPQGGSGLHPKPKDDKMKDEIKRLKAWKRKQEAEIDNSIMNLRTYSELIRTSLEIVLETQEDKIKRLNQLIKIFKSSLKNAEQRKKELMELGEE